MNKIEQKIINNQFHVLNIYRCELKVILYAANLGYENVTIENYRVSRNNNWDSLKIQLKKDLSIENYLCRDISMDLCISKEKFLSLDKIWNTQGVYAIFSKISPIRFRCCELEDIARYNALKNFEWNLEIIAPDSSGGDWSTFTSSDKEIIESIKLKYNE